ncbi:FKBP-type peptidyl-prolyl cis-trans isomerase [Persicitalea sp.]|uniref:FKBP-type peptidyl-prolyl cis-trans isomerase n=1 Tax=Persicitalea sp. TaxID=3100273 RepID=UPI003593BD89
MYRNLKSLAAFMMCATLVSTQTIAQTPKTVKKDAATVAPAPKTLKTALDSVAYAIGLSVGGSLKQQGLSDINTSLLLKAINETLKGQDTELSPEEGNQYIGEYFQKQASVKGNANLAAGQKYLEENKKRPNVKTTESGLQYEVIKLGEGPKPADTSTVKVHYHGTLTDGTVFDSSVERGEPVEFPVSGVIKGWTEALKLMPEGSKFRLFIPANLAYGERAPGPTIGPNSTLVFDVELLEIL